jgi:aminoglycoside phosphotransferase family enzyme
MEPDVAAFLASERAWSAPVEVVETHLSSVYLVGDEAWKRKKPVRFVGHDYRTLEARRQSCLREVRVNRRLAPDVYLGEVPVTREADGTLRVGGAGAAVDWLVHMRRVPCSGTLEEGLRRGGRLRARSRGVGELLARFYGQAGHRPVAASERVDWLMSANEAHRAALARVGFGPLPVTGPVAAWSERTRGRWAPAGSGWSRATGTCDPSTSS